MRASECLNLNAGIPLRVRLLKEEYAHFLADTGPLLRQLDCLTTLRGHAQIEAWKAQARAGEWDLLVAELLEAHYDPAYARSLGKNYTQAPNAPRFNLDDPGDAACRALARRVLDDFAKP
jgi:tRNA 2-selenouridine synthase